MVGAYGTTVFALVCFWAAVRNWPFPFAADRSTYTPTLDRGRAHSSGALTGVDHQDGAPGLTPGSRRVVVGQIPREPSAFVEQDALRALAEAGGRERVAVVCAVTGLRGVGKTQLAAAYVRDRIKQGWDLVGWVNAESRASLLADLARMARAVGVADADGDSLESARRLREYLNARVGKGLVVFDNADDPDMLRPFLPATGDIQVVITSTSQAFAEFGVPVVVTPFSRDKSLEYLAARSGLSDPDAATIVAAELGDLPLGLSQAAATIVGQHLSYQEYLERLRRVPVAVLLGQVRGGDYPNAAAAALLLNVQAAEADDSSGLVGRLLRVIAVLFADGVRRRILEAGALADGSLDVDVAVQQCVSASLLAWSVDGDTVIMHRLVGRVLRERDQALDWWEETVTAALDLLEPQLFPSDQAWDRREEGAQLAAHADALWKADAEADHSDPDLLRRILGVRSWAVSQFSGAADFSRAIDLGAATLADCEQILGDDYPDTFAARSNLASAYQGAGRFGEAVPLFEQTLADRERVLGGDHPDTLTARSNLGYAYMSAGRSGEAVPLFEQTLADRERVLGGDHLGTLGAWSDLAYAFESAGQVSEAVSLFERAHAENVRVLGLDHPYELATRNNLASVYYGAGRAGEAIQLFERTLADRERVLGNDHSDTLITRNNLATAYQSIGRVGEAISLYQRTVADCERTLGPDHPQTLESRIKLEKAASQTRRQ